MGTGDETVQPRPIKNMPNLAYKVIAKLYTLTYTLHSLKSDSKDVVNV
jgi:hypothetical protein